MQRIKPQYIILGVVLVIAALLVIPQLLTYQPGERVVEENMVTETIGVVETNTTATYQVGLVEGSDPEHESDHMFESLADLPGVGTASLDTQTLELTVNYDDASVDEAAIKDRLLNAGYIVPTKDDAAPLEMADDGSVQRIAVADNGQRFDPYLMIAKAGVPIEIEFAPGTECRVAVKFPDIGVAQDIAQGGVVALPALEPGDYQIACSGDGHEGTLIVE